jgi:LysR family hydrogen peroxide-inducible transcriptional activator
LRAAPHPFTLRQLQYALAVAEHASFRKAAEACRVAQPSLSTQVQALEDALGVRLFDRDRRRVIVTTAGAELLERMKRVLSESDDLVDASSRARDPFRGTMRIGIIPTVSPYLLPEVAPALRGAFPHLSIVWVEEKTAVLRARLAAGELDAAIVAKDSDLGDVERAVIGEDPFVLAAAPGHPLVTTKKLATLDELATERVLLLDDGHCFRDQALTLCRRAGADEAAVRATSLATLAQMVAGGAGVTLLPSLAVKHENRGGALRIRKFAPRAPSRTLVLVWRRRSALGGALEKVARALRTAYARCVG